MFPKVPDQHKPGKPLVANGIGVFYVLFATVYLFLIYFLGLFQSPAGVTEPISAPLVLASCILFGGFMGLLDDWMDLKWRYKAFMPLIAALPLIYYAKAIGADIPATQYIYGLDTRSLYRELAEAQAKI